MAKEQDPASGESLDQRPNGRKRLVRAIIFVLFVLVVGLQATRTVANPSLVNVVSLGCVAVLFLLMNAQLVLTRAIGERRMRHLMARLNGSSFLSDLDNLPNRNYLLAELRREIPRARAANTPFVMIVLSLESYEDIVMRRGPDFGDRALKGMAQVLRRFTRTSDFIAHLGGPRFAVLLNECQFDDSFIYLQRVPGSIAVSDGRRMLEVPVTARVQQYDMQGMYATDVLRDAEESQPLRRKEQLRAGAEAA